MCSPKTMLKIGAVIAVPMAIGFVAFPQFRVAILGLAPFALFALCPLSMLFMGGIMGDKKGKSCSSCEHDHVNGTKHISAKTESQ